MSAPTRALMEDYEVALGPTCWQTVTACLHYHLARLTSSSEQPLCSPPLVTIPDTAAPTSQYTPPQSNQPLWMSPGSQRSSSALSSLSVTDSLSQGTRCLQCCVVKSAHCVSHRLDRQCVWWGGCRRAQHASGGRYRAQANREQSLPGAVSSRPSRPLLCQVPRGAGAVTYHADDDCDCFYEYSPCLYYFAFTITVPCSIMKYPRSSKPARVKGQSSCQPSAVVAESSDALGWSPCRGVSPGDTSTVLPCGCRRGEAPSCMLSLGETSTQEAARELGGEGSGGTRRPGAGDLCSGLCVYTVYYCILGIPLWCGTPASL